MKLNQFYEGLTPCSNKCILRSPEDEGQGAIRTRALCQCACNKPVEIQLLVLRFAQHLMARSEGELE